ncbi:M24 family metallopeptidase [Bosea vaviloviae]|uniref:Aminopeptidase P family protein n=1 Tax=Bosea vaviloviae TaxID=1526658 RepID=A0A1D7UC88_9HYPH|nr:Xaa-Pro peptidase family protein [Bosea vaviloviae]AOO84980.1 hypothetical protein BHK69_30125 [Bosea vaviloviae]
MQRIDLEFSKEEFAQRLSAVRGIMADLDLQVLVLDELESMQWVSGFGISQTMWRCAVVPREGEPFLIVRSLDLVPAIERSPFSGIVGFKDWDDPVSVLADELRKRGLDKTDIGVEFDSSSMSVRRLADLKRELPDAQFKDIGIRIWELRAVKSPAEIEYLRRAAQICDEAVLRGVAAIKVGGRQRDVVKAAAITYLEMGADPGRVGPITTGIGWGALHGNEHTHPIEKGSIVHIELTPRVCCYSSRIMRSVVVGEPSKEQLDVMDQLIKIQDRQFAAMVPGAVAGDIDALAREPILAAGLRPSYDNITGYTLGCYPSSTQKGSEFVHKFTPAETWKLKEGMVLHMYLSAEGLAISEAVVVRSDGVERLTQCDRKLFSVAV